MIIKYLLLWCMIYGVKSIVEYDVFYGNYLTIPLEISGDANIYVINFNKTGKNISYDVIRDVNTTYLNFTKLTLSDNNNTFMIYIDDSTIYIKINVIIGACMNLSTVTEIYEIACMVTSHYEFEWFINFKSSRFINNSRFNIVNIAEWNMDEHVKVYVLSVRIWNDDDTTDVFFMRGYINGFYDTNSVSIHASNPITLI